MVYVLPQLCVKQLGSPENGGTFRQEMNATWVKHLQFKMNQQFVFGQVSLKVVS